MDPAVEIALEDINLNVAVLPGYRLERVVVDSKCDPGTGIKGFINAISVSDTTRPLVGVAGPGCSDVAVALVPTASLFNLVTQSASASSASLNDKSKYPHFMRTIPSSLIGKVK